MCFLRPRQNLESLLGILSLKHDVSVGVLGLAGLLPALDLAHAETDEGEADQRAEGEGDADDDGLDDLEDELEDGDGDGDGGHGDSFVSGMGFHYKPCN